MRRSVAIGGTLTRGDIETSLDSCDRLIAQRDEIVRGPVATGWVAGVASVSTAASHVGEAMNPA